MRRADFAKSSVFGAGFSRRVPQIFHFVLQLRCFDHRCELQRDETKARNAAQSSGVVALAEQIKGWEPMDPSQELQGR